MTFLLIGALIWSYLSMIFDVLSETVQWERWEGTIEYTFMSPTSRVTHLLGMGVYAIVYGIIRTALVLGVAMLAFDLDLVATPNYGAALVVLAVCSISLVGFGVVAAVMPLLSPEKGQQVTYIVSALLLLVSGVYYPVSVLPGWMQSMATVSPVTYAPRRLPRRATGRRRHRRSLGQHLAATDHGRRLRAARYLDLPPRRALRQADRQAEEEWVRRCQASGYRFQGFC